MRRVWLIAPDGSVENTFEVEEPGKLGPFPRGYTLTETAPAESPPVDPIKGLAEREPDLARWLVKLSRAAGIATEEADKADDALTKALLPGRWGMTPP